MASQVNPSNSDQPSPTTEVVEKPAETTLEKIEALSDDAIPTTEEKPEVEEVVEEPIEGEENLLSEAETEEEPEELAFHLNLKEVKEKYPDLFKDFPNLKRAAFHGRAMLEVFPSVEEAREARGRVEAIEGLETSLLNGDPSVLLDQLVNHDKSAARAFIENFLPTIREKAPSVYANISYPIIAQVLRAAAKDGQETQNENLYNAAVRINHFLTGKAAIPDLPERPRETEKERQLREGQISLQQKAFKDYEEDVYDLAEKEIKRRINKGIDESVPEDVREMLAEKIYREIGKQMQSDPAHMNKMNSYWKQAAKGGLPREWKAKIANAYLGRAVTILPKVRQKHIQGFVSSRAGQTKERAPEKKFIPGSSTAPGSKKVSSKDIDWSRTSSQDYLDEVVGGMSGKITLKR